jgi:hypothetical protein
LAGKKIVIAAADVCLKHSSTMQKQEEKERTLKDKTAAIAA